MTAPTVTRWRYYRLTWIEDAPLPANAPHYRVGLIIRLPQSQDPGNAIWNEETGDFVGVAWTECNDPRDGLVTP